MNKELSNFAARLREMISSPGPAIDDRQFCILALELFAVQFQSNVAYRKICEARQLTLETVEHWTQIPFVPTGVFKELELSSIPPDGRTAVFHSSGTTEQKPSRHFHCAESLAVYEASLWHWFKPHFNGETEFIFLTPNQGAAPCSSLVHMFETVQKARAGLPAFYGNVAADGAWTIDFDAIVQKLQSSCDSAQPLTVFGTAFSFVHLLDFLTEKRLRFDLPKGSQVMETGGYKNRSRVLPKDDLHALITQQLGVARQNIICEYGMSELSSQAYDSEINPPARRPRIFHFPPWSRVQITSPETGCEVADGETGLIRIFDLANVFSVAAVQTEDLGIRRGNGFELVGRVQLAEPRGCSLMTA